MTRISVHDDGMYHIGNRKYNKNKGSRAEVWHRTAYQTTGGLTHKNLKQNEEGRIVSRAKSRLGKTQKHLGSHLQSKGSGVFGSNKTMKNKSKKGGTTKKGGMKNKSKKGGTTKKGGTSCHT
jgi:hypothetical protein